MLTYRIKAGDNLYVLAQRHLVRLDSFRTIQRINHIVDPRHILVGRPIRIPRPLLRFSLVEGKILAFRGDVKVQGHSGVRPAAVGAEVREGDRIVTGPYSFVSLGLPDASVVSLPTQSSVLVARLRRISLTGAVERQFRIGHGRLRAIVTPLGNRDDSFQVTTPVSTAAVRGTEFRVSYAPGKQIAATELLEGKLDVSAADTAGTRRLEPGYGNITSADAVSHSLPLLPAPALIQPGRVQDDDRLIFRIAPLQGARSYHVQLAQDAGFIDTVSEVRTNGNEDAILPPLPDGTWFVRLGGIDESGLEGLPATYSFERRLSKIEADVTGHRTGRIRQYFFRWRPLGEDFVQFRFQLINDPQTAPLIDLPGLTEHSVVITDLPPGSYAWRVMSLQKDGPHLREKWSPYQQLMINRSE